MPSANASHVETRRMVNYAFVVLSLITVLTSPSIATAQSRPAAESKSAAANRALIESLASKNKPPEIEDIHVRAVPDGFDPKEQTRVWAVIPKLIKQAEQAWPELVDHLDDKRYCVTVNDLFGNTHNWTIGDVCREIIGRNLAQAYYKALPSDSFDLYRTMRKPGFAYDKEWCRHRADKKLYELQLEACAWASTGLADENRIEKASPATRKAWITAVDAAAKKLAESKTAVPYPRFGPEEFDLYQPPGDDPDPFAP